MDQLIYLAIFALFSAVSAILDRRRRRQSLEEARRRHEAAQKQGPARSPVAVDKEEEEEEGKWPWPEIFEQPPSRPRRVEREQAPAEVVATEAGAPETGGEGKYRRAEEELREMEQRVREMDRRTREADRKSQEEFRLMELQAAARMGSGGVRSGAAPAGENRLSRQGWRLDPREARRAVVWAEILGPPKSERLD